MAINHADTTDIHLFAYVQTTDPGAVGSGKAWVDTSGATRVLKVRNTANTGWDTVGSAGVAIGNTVTGATQGSLLFAGASGALSQDNAGLFWDSTNKKLTLTNNGTNDEGLILKSASLYYAPSITFKYNSTTLSGSIQSEYTGGLVLTAPPSRTINLGGVQGLPGKLVAQGYMFESGGTAVQVNTINAGVAGLAINLAASQTADAMQVQDSSGNKIYSIDNLGNIVMKSGNYFVLDSASGTSISKSPNGFTVFDSFNSVSNISYYGRSFLGNFYSSFESRQPVALIDGTPTNVATLYLPTLDPKGGMFKAVVRAKDSSDAQSLTQIIRWEAVNKGGTYAKNISVINEGSVCTTGTIAASWDITTQTEQITFRCNANTSLTPTTLEVILQSIGNILN